MLPILKAIYRPLDNRYYNGKKRNLLLFGLEYVPMIALCIYGGLAVNRLFFWGVPILLCLMVLQYVLFDKLSDYFWWKFFFKKHYQSEVHPPNELHDTMREFDKNPTTNNQVKLHGRLANSYYPANHPQPEQKQPHLPK